ncbi:hypothetical protein GCM10007981_18270 [Thermocladium modestius]|uniref:Uncharacterized protein n=1 Tax=Thermocladium modestius TaxID=62609 RepID=A0A830GYM6_9CREN|nr:hypothetical protein GCM10007981_18270 [Thermocladium modestius]
MLTAAALQMPWELADVELACEAIKAAPMNNAASAIIAAARPTLMRVAASYPFIRDANMAIHETY